MPPQIAILGWGSLLWDPRPDFDEHHGPWQYDGPDLPIEFSRVSETRGKSLTLVIDEAHGSPCQVAYAVSERSTPDDVIADLRCREGTTLARIGYYFADDSRKQSQPQKVLEAIAAWARTKAFGVVVWTDLKSNFQRKSLHQKPFSVENAIDHLQSLGADGKVKAAEYVWRAPDFVTTPLRSALQLEPWFPRRIFEDVDKNSVCVGGSPP
jgi:cation transport regulator ChaC